MWPTADFFRPVAHFSTDKSVVLPFYHKTLNFLLFKEEKWHQVKISPWRILHQNWLLMWRKPVFIKQIVWAYFYIPFCSLWQSWQYGCSSIEESSKKLVHNFQIHIKQKLFCIHKVLAWNRTCFVIWLINGCIHTLWCERSWPGFNCYEGESPWAPRSIQQLKVQKNWKTMFDNFLT